VVHLVLMLQVESSLQFQIQALQKSHVKNKTLKKGNQKAYPKVAPHCPLSGSIRRVGRMIVISQTCGSRAGITTLRELSRAVQLHEVTQDSINLPFMDCAIKCSVLPLVVGQICKIASNTINNRSRLWICGDRRRRRDVVALPSSPSWRHLSG
jgi:hypothetical protein